MKKMRANKAVLLILPVVTLFWSVIYSNQVAYPEKKAREVYQIERVTLPAEMSPEISAIAFSPAGALVVANRHGEIWIREDGSWHRFAYGLHEPLGILAPAAGEVYVIHRPELTLVKDIDGDGRADHFDTLSDAWGITDNYHEFAYGLKRDADGNFYGGLGLESAGEIDRSRGPLRREPVLQEKHRSWARFRGWVFQITGQGEFVPLAMGFRQPCGIGLSPDGDLFVTDNQGDWVASSTMVHIRKDHFYGHPASLKWTPDYQPDSLSREMLWNKRTLPAVVFPHGLMGGSPGEPVWDLTAGAFGPFESQIFVGDFSSLISRVVLEKVGGEYQGACFPFIRGERIGPGNMRMAFGPEGDLYVAQTTRGWAEGDGLKKIVWNGQVPMELSSIKLTDSGFLLQFTQPPPPDQAGDLENYSVTRFQYHYHHKYGSPRINESSVAVVDASLKEDGVQLVLEDLKPGFIYQIQVSGVASSDGQELGYGVGYYTLNRLLSGERLTQLPVERSVASTEPGQKPLFPGDSRAGEELYDMYCSACHMPDGTGSPGVGAASFRAADSPLDRTDSDLLQIISEGREEKGMPPFGATLASGQIADIITYLREVFGENRDSAKSPAEDP